MPSMTPGMGGHPGALYTGDIRPRSWNWNHPLDVLRYVIKVRGAPRSLNVQYPDYSGCVLRLFEMFFGLFIFSGAVVSAQQIYIENQGRPPRPNCNIPTATAEPFAFTAGDEPPLYHFSPFSYTLTETVRIASPVTPSPLPQYGPRYTAVSHLLPDISTTSWGNWDPTAVPTAVDTADPYGQDAYSSLWKAVNLQNLTRGLYTTTVSPTPVPTSELILPPPLYFGPHDCYSFPEDFMLGVSGAAAQIEGAVADEGRSPAVTDLLGDLGQSLGLPTVTDNDYTTVENYYLYKQDIKRLAAMGMRYYSFSIPWTRILPFSVPGSPVNSQALEHYNDLINFAIEKGIQPIVTLIHFDTPALFIGNNPAALAERAYIGRVNYGFQNETFEDAFVNYGKIVMSHFADRVPIWITFNEAQFGSISGPGVNHVLKSHARLYHFYKEELHGKGKVSMKMGATPGIPLSPSDSSHRAAAEHYTDLNLGTYLNPLVLGQDYPEAYKMTVQDYIPLTARDLSYLNGTLGT